MPTKPAAHVDTEVLIKDLNLLAVYEIAYEIEPDSEYHELANIIAEERDILGVMVTFNFGDENGDGITERRIVRVALSDGRPGPPPILTAGRQMPLGLVTSLQVLPDGRPRAPTPTSASIDCLPACGICKSSIQDDALTAMSLSDGASKGKSTMRRSQAVRNSDNRAQAKALSIANAWRATAK